MDISNKIEDGLQTAEIKQMEKRNLNEKELRDKMIRGQLNYAFNLTKS
jgi:MerR family transcriptional regulator, global nitrogen regulator